jgi:hypothetical protein
MSTKTSKFARTDTIESALRNLRLAAEAGDSARVVTAAGELRNLLNFFKRNRQPFNNVQDARKFIQSYFDFERPSESYFDPERPREFVNFLHALLQGEVLYKGSKARPGVQRQIVKNFIPDDPNNPAKLWNSETLKEMIESGKVIPKGGPMLDSLQSFLKDNNLKAILNRAMDPEVAYVNPKSPRSVTLYQLLTDPSIKLAPTKSNQPPGPNDLVILDRDAFFKHVHSVANEFAEKYRDTSRSHYRKNFILKWLLGGLLAKLGINLGLPLYAAYSMGSPSASDVQQAVDIDEGGSDPATPANGASAPNSSTGHPAMTNGNNFGNLGGVQGGYDMANYPNVPFSQHNIDYSPVYRNNVPQYYTNPNVPFSERIIDYSSMYRNNAPQYYTDPNVPFSERIIDYSSMYRENASQNARVALAQAQNKLQVPPEVQDYLNQIPDLQDVVQHIIALIKANGGPESPKAIQAANAYVAQIESKVDPLLKAMKL